MAHTCRTRKTRSVEYEELVVIDGFGQLTLRDVGTEIAIYLVVSVVSPAWNTAETFDYRYQMDMGATSSDGGGGDDGLGTTPEAWGDWAFGDSGDDKQGCACTNGGALPMRGVWLLLPLACLVVRRRH